MQQKRLIISALSGGGGKTLSTLAVTRAFTENQQEVIAFKKGPDYIDATWLSLAARKKCYNLDPFFLDKEELIQHFTSVCSRAKENSLAIIEGNRGLYDGKDLEGSASTAELAVSLSCPVILTIDAKKATRTLAALVNGIISFDSRVNVAGLIINNIASKRHEETIFKAINHYCSVPILGFIPRIENNPLPERHLGLIFEDNAKSEEILCKLSKIAQDNIDLTKLLEIASTAPLLESEVKTIEIIQESTKQKLRIGYIKDKALWFYYSENLELLEASMSEKGEGVELIALSLFENPENWENIDALYIGGGYPELCADEIAKSFALEKIHSYAEENMPIYAECGGFMVLTSAITKAYTKEKHGMANIFGTDLEFYEKPQGLGYVEAVVVGQNPYFAKDTKIKGHEFHYSLAKNPPQEAVFKITKGTGMGNHKDGLVYKNVFASYTHIYALSHKEWAKNLIELASQYKESKNV